MTNEIKLMLEGAVIGALLGGVLSWAITFYYARKSDRQLKEQIERLDRRMEVAKAFLHGVKVAAVPNDVPSNPQQTQWHELVIQINDTLTRLEK